MSDRIDKALDALDAGLQSSPEHGYGTDALPDRCARCQHHPRPETGDLCPGCRAFLLGDSELDPRRRTGTLTVTVAHYDPEHDTLTLATRSIQDACAMAGPDLDELAEGFRRFASAVAPVVEWVSAAFDVLVDAGMIDEDGFPVEAPYIRGRERRALVRAEEREHLAALRRRHRRTNRWGSPPGRS